MPAPRGFDHVSTTKSNSTRSIAAHPCKKRKDGAPSVRMVHTKIVKGGPPAITNTVGAPFLRVLGGQSFPGLR
jgi:hypothetical protein